jgi:hypothetical protein
VTTAGNFRRAALSGAPADTPTAAVEQTATAAYRRCVTWSEHHGAVTQAFDEWRLVDADIRRFLQVTGHWMDERYEQTWREVGAQPATDESASQVDAFHAAVDGLDPSDFRWMLGAAALRDAVTAFEVYLEKAGGEVLRAHRKKWDVTPGQSPWWADMVKFYRRALKVEIDAEPVARIRRLRHVLAHQRGELRTADLRARYASADETALWLADVDEPVVLDACDVLGAAVRRFDPVAWTYSWGGQRLPADAV